MESQARVAAIIPVYNGAASLRAAVLSVLAQTHENLEVWVVDDGSTDGSLKQIEDLLGPVRVLEQENRGRSAAINRALAASDADFFCVSDADDLSHPERVARQLQPLLADPSLGGCFCGHEMVVGSRHLAPRLRAKDVATCRRNIERFIMPGHDPTGLYRRSRVAGLLFETSLRIGGGFDFVLRVGEQQPLVVLGDCLYSYRIHAASSTRSDPSRRDELVRRVLSRACERRGLDPAAALGKAAAAPRRPSHRRADNNLAAHFIESAIDLRRAGYWREALDVGLFSARLHPDELHYYKALVYALAPATLLARPRPDE